MLLPEENRRQHMDFVGGAGMRMSRRLALYAAGGGKATVGVYGAPSETITLITAKGESIELATDAHGIASSVEIPLGLCTIKGSVSSEILTAGRTVIVDKDTTQISAYPQGAIFWFGNGVAEGDSLYGGSYWHQGGHVPSGKSGASGYSKLASGSNYIGATVSTPSTSGSYYGGTTWGPLTQLAGYSHVNIYASGNPTARTAFGFSAEQKNGWSTDMYVTPSTTAYQLYSMPIPSTITAGYLAISGFNCKSGGTWAEAYLKAAWRDDKAVTPIGEQLAGTNKIDVLSETERYLSSSGAWSTAGSISTDNYVGANSSEVNSALIPVGSFSFSGTPKRLRLSLYGYCPSVNFYTKGFRWAICTSNANKALYQTTDDVITDGTQVAKGTATFAYNNGTYKTYEIDISSASIPSGTQLYVYLWPNGSATDIAHFRGTLTASLYYEA